MSSRPPSPDGTLAWLERLVAFPTVSDTSNLPLVEAIQTFLEGHGVSCRLFPNERGDKAALLATIGPGERPGIVLSGHMDVVPVAGQEWTGDPFSLRVQDGKAYGRGAVDMKGFLAAILAAVPAMVAKRLSTPIHLLFSYDEEVTCLGSLDALATFGTELPMPRAAIVGEPTSMQVADAHKGVSVYRTVVYGHAVHSSFPEQGANAILGATMLIGEIDRLADELIARGDASGRFDPPYSTMHVGTIRGGIAVNIVPAACEFIWEIRNLPDLNVPDALSRMEDYVARTVIPRLRRGTPHADIRTTVLVSVPGLAPEPGSPAESLALALAGLNRTTCVSYATEAGQFQRKGIPTVICGPGSIDQAHQPDEFIELEQLDACDVFLRRLTEWCALN